MKIMVSNEDGKPFRMYYGPREIIVKPTANLVEIQDESGTTRETYELLERKLGWLDNPNADCSEIYLELTVKQNTQKPDTAN